MQTKNRKKLSNEINNLRRMINDKDIPVIEWVAASIGLLLVTGTIAYVLYEGFQGNSDPPKIKLRVESIENLGDYFLAKIKVENVGEMTVKSLLVEGVLINESGTAEKSEITFDFVPSNSERSGGLLFKKDPKNYKLEIRALGFEEP